MVSINPNKNPQKGILTLKPRLGRLRQSTLEDGPSAAPTVGPQWPNKVQKCPQRRMAAATKFDKRTLMALSISRRLINNRLVQAEQL